MSESVPASEWVADAEVLTWFAERHTARPLDEATPLARWIKMLRLEASRRRVIESGGSDPASGKLRTGQALAYSYDLYAARASAWSIRAIHGADAEGRLKRLDIHASFVGAEFCRADDQSTLHLQMPAGIGTLLTAARCALEGGESLTIFGSGSPGLDIEWSPESNVRVRFEAKSRAFSATFNPQRDADDLARDAVNRMQRAGRDLRRRSARDRVRALNAVTFVAIVPSEISDALVAMDWGNRFQQLESVHPSRLPQWVVLRWLGLGFDGKSIVARHHQTHHEVLDAEPIPPHRARRSMFRAMQLA